MGAVVWPQLKLWHEPKTAREDRNIFRWYTGIQGAGLPSRAQYPRTKVWGELTLLKKKDESSVKFSYTRMLLVVSSSSVDLAAAINKSKRKDVAMLTAEGVEKKVTAMRPVKAFHYIRKKLGRAPLPYTDEEILRYLKDHGIVTSDCLSYPETDKLIVVSGVSLLQGSTTTPDAFATIKDAGTKHFVSCMRPRGGHHYTWHHYVQAGGFAIFHLRDNELIGRIHALPLRARTASPSEEYKYAGWCRPYGTFNSDNKLRELATKEATRLVLGEQGVHCSIWTSLVLPPADGYIGELTTRKYALNYGFTTPYTPDIVANFKVYPDQMGRIIARFVRKEGTC